MESAFGVKAKFLERKTWNWNIKAEVKSAKQKSAKFMSVLYCFFPCLFILFIFQNKIPSHLLINLLLTLVAC